MAVVEVEAVIVITCGGHVVAGDGVAINAGGGWVVIPLSMQAGVVSLSLSSLTVVGWPSLLMVAVSVDNGSGMVVVPSTVVVVGSGVVLSPLTLVVVALMVVVVALTVVVVTLMVVVVVSVLVVVASPLMPVVVVSLLVLVVGWWWWWLSGGGQCMVWWWKMERIRMKDLEKFLKCVCVRVFVYMIISY